VFCARALAKKYFCELCGREITQEESLEYDGLCEDCFKEEKLDEDMELLSDDLDLDLW